MLIGHYVQATRRTHERRAYPPELPGGAAEVQDFGIKVTLVEPTGYETDCGGASSVQATKLPFYECVRAKLAEIFGAVRRTRGNPQATGPAILKVVDADRPPQHRVMNEPGSPRDKARRRRRREERDVHVDGISPPIRSPILQLPPPTVKVPVCEQKKLHVPNTGCRVVWPMASPALTHHPSRNR
jgi:hypothetical protein